MLSPTTLSQPYPNPIQLVFTEHLPCSVSKESTYNAGDCLQCRRLPAMQETPVWSLGQENPLEKEMATHSSIFAWEIPWIEEPGRLQFMGSQRVRHNWAMNNNSKEICISLGFNWYLRIVANIFWDEMLVAQLCPTLCNPMDCSLPGSSVHGISQARILTQVAISFSRGFSWSRDRTRVSCIAGIFFTIWATREVSIF